MNVSTITPSTLRLCVVGKAPLLTEAFQSPDPAALKLALKLKADEERREKRIVEGLKIAGIVDIPKGSLSPVVENELEPCSEEGNISDDSGSPNRQINSTVPARRIEINGNYSDPDSLSDLPFPEAVRKWHAIQRAHVNPRTHQNNWHNAMQLLKFFGDMKLSEMRVNHLRGYQHDRTENVDQRWKKKAGPSIINHEMSVMQQMLKHAGQWNKFRDHYHALPLPAPKEQKVFTEEEEVEFLKLVASRQDLLLPCLVTMMTFNTTVAGRELRMLKWKDIDLDSVDAEGKPDPALNVPDEGAKNEYRVRRVPLNETALEVMSKIMERARRLGSTQLDHYLFPYSVRGYHYDPTRPTSESWLKRDWNKLRKAAKAPWLTPHCIRYMAITALYEAGVPEPTIQAMAGHNSARMSRRYNRSRRAQMKAAAAVLDSSRRNEIKPEWKQFVETEARPQCHKATITGARIISFPGRITA